MDIFLIATVLFIFAMGMYELFIEKINLPEWLIINNLHDLKAKLSSVIILVMGITFLKHLVEWTDPQGTLYFRDRGCCCFGCTHSIRLLWRQGLIYGNSSFIKFFSVSLSQLVSMPVIQAQSLKGNDLVEVFNMAESEKLPEVETESFK